MKKKLMTTLSILLAISLLSACSTPAQNSSDSSQSAVSTSSASSEVTVPDPVYDANLKTDFYDTVNADWLASATIPADKPYIGGFMDLRDDIEKKLTTDFAQMISGDKQPTSDELAQFIEYYRLALDFDTRNKAGVQPLLPYLEMIEGLSSVDDYAKKWVEWDLNGMSSPLSVAVATDLGNASANALYFSTPGLYLRDKSYYADEAAKTQLQGAYNDMLVKLLVMAGKTQAEATVIAKEAIAFDESLVPYMRTAEQASDVSKMNNPTTLKELDDKVQAFNLTEIVTELVGKAPESVIVLNPEYYTGLDKIVNENTLKNMKSWMLANTLVDGSAYLSDELRVEAGSFGRIMSGVAEAVAAEKAAFYSSVDTFDEVVGIYYGQTYFGQAAKQDVTDMVDKLIAVYKNRLNNNTWLSDATKAKAIQKLGTISVNIAYPDTARPIYSKMVIMPASQGGTLLGNDIALTRVIKQDQYNQLSQPVDRGEWPLSAHTVNAMYNPQNNSINFPAAILQAPFYSLEQSPEENYGGIGSIIAHEITHAFDPNGSKFDELGNMKNWWSEEDYAKFNELSQAMIKEFDGIEHAGAKINGTLTVTENIADAGGLSSALEAVKSNENADLSAFFTNYAAIWRGKFSPEIEQLIIATDVHAPNKFRVNIQVQNMDDFFTTFDVKEGDPMYRAPEDRVNIW